MKKLLFLLLSLTFLGSCVSEQSEPDNTKYETRDDRWTPENDALADNEVALMSTARGGRAANFKQVQQTDSKVIKTANLQLEVASLDNFSTSIKSLLEKFEAYTTNENQSNVERRSEVSMTIRVPASGLELLLDEIGELGKSIESQSISQRDVTEEFIDMETRLENRKALEARYRQLLSQARNVNETMQIERQLNNLRSEIESQEGRLKYLSNQVELSTLFLTAFEKKPYIYKPEDQDSFGQRILKSLSKGWQSVVDTVIWLFSLWPLAILFLAIVIYWKRR